MIKSNLENENLNDYISNNMELKKWSDQAQEETNKAQEKAKVFPKYFKEVPNIYERCFEHVKKDIRSDEQVWQEKEPAEIMEICDFEVFDMILESYKKKIRDLQFESQENLFRNVLGKAQNLIRNDEHIFVNTIFKDLFEIENTFQVMNKDERESVERIYYSI